ncbi:hypothetical protein [Endozoicomonas sp. YOMI1]|uniref:hypothetical protein n=1 Tax=Endozoicomonas sp. YOMI1 TaxID=2828739 RepID=UPI002148F1DA|nr:hypothetical protein [Endozoicomonas sp. YOMI1]
MSVNDLMNRRSRWLLSDSVFGKDVEFVVAVAVVFSVGFVRLEILAVFSCGVLSGVVVVVVVVFSTAVPVDAGVIDEEEAAELSLEAEITDCLAVSGVVCFDCLACAAVEMIVEVGDGVVLSEMRGSPPAAVVADDNAACPVVD